MNNYLEIQHASLIVKNTRDALAFYCDVLGLERVERPELGFPGAWLRVGSQQIHLLEVPNPDPEHGRPAHGGRDRHTAITVSNLEWVQQRLDSAEHAYTVSRSGRAAIFVRDQDGNTLEFIQQ